MRSIDVRRKLAVATAKALHAHINLSWNSWAGEVSVDPAELDRAIKNGWLREGIGGWKAKVTGPGRVLLMPEPNLVTNSGIDRSMDQTFISGTASATNIIDSIGVDNGTANPSATTSQSADGNSTSRTIIAMSPAAARTGQQVSCGGTFTNSNVAFVMKRLFLNRSTTDAAGNLYAMTNVFTIDMTSFSSWAQSFSPTVSGTGS